MCAKKKSFAFSNISSDIIAPQGRQKGLLRGPQPEQLGASAKRQLDIDATAARAVAVLNSVQRQQTANGKSVHVQHQGKGEVRIRQGRAATTRSVANSARSGETMRQQSCCDIAIDTPIKSAITHNRNMSRVYACVVGICCLVRIIFKYTHQTTYTNDTYKHNHETSPEPISCKRLVV